MHTPLEQTSGPTHQIAPSPSGRPATASQTSASDVAIAVMWAIVGALASGGGAVVGVILGLSSSSPCTGVLCGLEGAFTGALVGWTLGALIAVGSSISIGGGIAIDRAARGLSAVFGVVVLPMLLALPAVI